MDDCNKQWINDLRYRQDVRKKRPRLLQSIGDKTSFLLQGNPDGKIIVAIIEDNETGLTIVEDSPSLKADDNDPLGEMYNCEEKYTEIRLSANAFQTLIALILERSGMELVAAKNKGGRPSKYTTNDAKRITALHVNEGMSIRQIAAKERMSTATVQKLLKRYEPVAMLENLSRSQ